MISIESIPMSDSNELELRVASPSEDIYIEREDVINCGTALGWIYFNPDTTTIKEAKLKLISTMVSNIISKTTVLEASLASLRKLSL
jgi:hypothetical protein